MSNYSTHGIGFDRAQEAYDMANDPQYRAEYADWCNSHEPHAIVNADGFTLATLPCKAEAEQWLARYQQANTDLCDEIDDCSVVWVGYE